MNKTILGSLITDSVKHEQEIKKIIAYYTMLLKELAKYAEMTEEQIEDFITDTCGGYMGLGDAEEIIDMIKII